MLAAQMVAATSRDVMRLSSPPTSKLTKAASVDKCVAGEGGELGPARYGSDVGAAWGGEGVGNHER